jgi:ferritin-like metal-binding protein YciE
MKANNRKEVVVALLSNLMEGRERASKFHQELRQYVQDPAIQEIIEAREFVAQKVHATIEECFRILGEKPVKTSNHLQEVFFEDFKREIGEIQAPEAKLLFVLAKLNHLTHLRIGELVALTAAADVTGHHAVGLLLETVLADKLALVERNRRFIRNWVEKKVEARMVA